MIDKELAKQIVLYKLYLLWLKRFTDRQHLKMCTANNKDGDEEGDSGIAALVQCVIECNAQCKRYTNANYF